MTATLSMKHFYNLLYVTGLYRLLWHKEEPLPQLERWYHRGLLQGGHALDIGCGAGTNTLWLADHAFSTVAADFCEAALRRVERKARARRLPVELMLLDVTRPAPPMRRFDLVVDRECLQDLPSPSMREQYAQNLRRWLTPGGVYVVSLWLRRAGARPALHPSVSEGMVEGLFPDLSLEERDVGRPSKQSRGIVQAVYRFRAKE